MPAAFSFLFFFRKTRDQQTVDDFFKLDLKKGSDGNSKQHADNPADRTADDESCDDQHGMNIHICAQKPGINDIPVNCLDHKKDDDGNQQPPEIS